MEVKLLHATPLYIAAHAIRKCWDSGDKSDTQPAMVEVIPDGFQPTGELICGPNDRALIDRVGNKFKHASTLEHLVYSFDISGVSRALLQELARHRLASPSVKSTRYTLKELKDCAISQETAEKFLVMTGNTLVDAASKKALWNIQGALLDGVSNDIAKYCLPEAYKTSLSWTINARSLQNFLSLRGSKAALWEIRDLANTIYDVLPEDHKYLFEHCIGDN